MTSPVSSLALASSCSRLAPGSRWPGDVDAPEARTNPHHLRFGASPPASSAEPTRHAGGGAEVAPLLRPKAAAVALGCAAREAKRIGERQKRSSAHYLTTGDQMLPTTTFHLAFKKSMVVQVYCIYRGDKSAKSSLHACARPPENTLSRKVLAYKSIILIHTFALPRRPALLPTLSGWRHPQSAPRSPRPV